MEPLEQIEPQGSNGNLLPEPPPTTWRDSRLTCALVAVGTTGALGCALMWLSLGRYQAYGSVLFVCAPGFSSFLAVLLHQWARPVNRHTTSLAGVVVGVLAVAVSMFLLLASAGEGIICVLMALPFALIIAVVGAVFGGMVANLIGPQPPVPMFTLVLLLYPALQEYEARHPAPVEPRLVTTQLTVNAPPAVVWATLQQPQRYEAAAALFRAGVVYPTRTAFAQDSATGCRTLVCHYSQGLARLPIVGWEEGRRITFAVPPPSMPAPMRELSPYPSIHAPHLHGFFQVDSGTFRLWPLPGGRTLLEARTVYRHSIGPQTYWQLWSNHLLDAVHEQVLTTIKAQAELHHD